MIIITFKIVFFKFKIYQKNCNLPGGASVVVIVGSVGEESDGEVGGDASVEVIGSAEDIVELTATAIEGIEKETQNWILFIEMIQQAL